MIRLSAEEFEKIPFKHLMTIVDDVEFSMTDSNMPLISGISEWVAHDRQGREVSIGFDWKISTTAEQAEIRLAGKPRHNLQVFDSKGKELDIELPCLQRLLERTDWQRPILEQLQSTSPDHRH